MSRPSSTLYTKDQLEGLFGAWGCHEPIPGKGSKVVICFADKDEWEVDLIEVEHTDLRSDYSKRLWKATMSSLRGREVQASVVEDHVIVYHGHCAELRRQANRARNAAAISVANPEAPYYAPDPAAASRAPRRRTP